jgi:hypothetical protein
MSSACMGKVPRWGWSPKLCLSTPHDAIGGERALLLERSGALKVVLVS